MENPSTAPNTNQSLGIILITDKLEHFLVPDRTHLLSMSLIINVSIENTLKAAYPNQYPSHCMMIPIERGRRDQKNEYNGRGSTWLECKVMIDFMLLIIRWTRSLNGKTITMLASFNVFSIQIIVKLCDFSWRQTTKKVAMSYLF